MSDISNPSATLFVYGTLLQESESEMAEFMRRNSTDMGKGYFFGRLYNLGHYPGAIAVSDRAEKVYGHVYRLHDAAAVLPVLDAYEEYGPGFPEPYLYVREKVEVHSNGATRTCWVYLYNGAVDEATKIPSGDYLAFLQQQ